MILNQNYRFGKKIIDLVLKLNFDTQNQLNMSVLYELFAIQNLTQNSRFGKIWPQVSNTILFYKVWYSKQRQYASVEYTIWK